MVVTLRVCIDMPLGRLVAWLISNVPNKNSSLSSFHLTTWRPAAAWIFNWELFFLVNFHLFSFRLAAVHGTSRQSYSTFAFDGYRHQVQGVCARCGVATLWYWQRANIMVIMKLIDDSSQIDFRQFPYVSRFTISAVRPHGLTVINGYGSWIYLFSRMHRSNSNRTSNRPQIGHASNWISAQIGTNVRANESRNKYNCKCQWPPIPWRSRAGKTSLQIYRWSCRVADDLCNGNVSAFVFCSFCFAFGFVFVLSWQLNEWIYMTIYQGILRRRKFLFTSVRSICTFIGDIAPRPLYPICCCSCWH